MTSDTTNSRESGKTTTHIRRLAALGATAAITLTLAACSCDLETSGTAASRGPKTGTLNIVYIQKQGDQQYFVDEAADARAEAERLGDVTLISNGTAQGYTGADSFFVFLSRGAVAGIPVLILMFLVLAAAVHVMLTYTDVGRNIHAIGGNKVAARLSGLRINKYVIGAYMLMGIIAAIAGILLTARTGSGQPTSGSQGLELQVITAVALGGCALMGGKGSIVGTVLAVVLLGILTNGLQILGVNPFWQDIAQGAMLVIAVVIQQRRRGTRAVGLPD